MQSSRYEQNAATPVAVPTTAPSPLATSSARPGKQTNQRVVYARVSDSLHADLDPCEIMEGDVVFVHRYDGVHVTGRDASRSLRIANIQQLNQLLSFESNVLGNEQVRKLPSGNPDPPFHSRADLEQVRRVKGEDAGAFYGDSTNLSALYELTGDSGLYKELKTRAGYADVQPTVGYENNPTAYAWERRSTNYRDGYCSVLRQWSLDGVVVGTEHQHSQPRLTPDRGDASNPGELFNVCVGGPTKMRNSRRGEFSQCCDEHVQVLQNVYVGLVALDVYDADEKQAYLYQYRLFSQRQLLELSADAETPRRWRRKKKTETAGADVDISMHDVLSMIRVWRVGRVLDTNSGMRPDHGCVTVNVVVEDVDVRRLFYDCGLHAIHPQTLSLPSSEAELVKGVDTLKTRLSEVQEAFRSFESTVLASDDEKKRFAANVAYVKDADFDFASMDAQLDEWYETFVHWMSEDDFENRELRLSLPGPHLAELVRSDDNLNSLHIEDSRKRIAKPFVGYFVDDVVRAKSADELVRRIKYNNVARFAVFAANRELMASLDETTHESLLVCAENAVKLAPLSHAFRILYKLRSLGELHTSFDKALTAAFT